MNLFCPEHRNKILKYISLGSGPTDFLLVLINLKTLRMMLYLIAFSGNVCLHLIFKTQIKAFKDLIDGRQKVTLLTSFREGNTLTVSSCKPISLWSARERKQIYRNLDVAELTDYFLPNWMMRMKLKDYRNYPNNNRKDFKIIQKNCKQMLG